YRVTSSLSVAWFCVSLALSSFPTRRSSDLGGIFDLFRVFNWALLSLDKITPPINHSANCSEGFYMSLISIDKAMATIGILASLRSEEHTSELQSRENLVCRLLLEKKKHAKI